MSYALGDISTPDSATKMVSQTNTILVEAIRPLYPQIDASPLSSSQKEQLKYYPIDALLASLEPIETLVKLSVNRANKLTGEYVRVIGAGKQIDPKWLPGTPRVQVAMNYDQPEDEVLAPEVKNFVRRLRAVNNFMILYNLAPKFLLIAVAQILVELGIAKANDVKRFLDEADAQARKVIPSQITSAVDTAASQTKRVADELKKQTEAVAAEAQKQANKAIETARQVTTDAANRAAVEAQKKADAAKRAADHAADNAKRRADEEAARASQKGQDFVSNTKDAVTSLFSGLGRISPQHVYRRHIDYLCGLGELDGSLGVAVVDDAAAAASAGATGAAGGTAGAGGAGVEATKTATLLATAKAITIAAAPHIAALVIGLLVAGLTAAAGGGAATGAAAMPKDKNGTIADPSAGAALVRGAGTSEKTDNGPIIVMALLAAAAYLWNKK